MTINHFRIIVHSGTKVSNLASKDATVLSFADEVALRRDVTASIILKVAQCTLALLRLIRVAMLVLSVVIELCGWWTES